MPFTGVTLNAAPLHIVLVIAVITGVGFTVTLTVAVPAVVQGLMPVVVRVKVAVLK